MRFPGFAAEAALLRGSHNFLINWQVDTIGTNGPSMVVPMRSRVCEALIRCCNNPDLQPYQRDYCCRAADRRNCG